MSILIEFRFNLVRAVLLSFLYCFTATPSFAYDANVVDNVVYINLTAQGYKNVLTKYVISSSSVTKDQDPNQQLAKGTTLIYDKNDAQMSFMVGRIASVDVAKFFANAVPANRNTFNQTPAALNFAFIGTMTITLTGGTLGSVKNTYTLDDVAFAQGSVGLSNNWWFGGKNCIYTSGYTVKCTGRNSTSGFKVNFYFTRGGLPVLPHSVDTVYLERIEYPQYEPSFLQKAYQGEDKKCATSVQQPARVCPPYVLYYTPEQVASLKLHNEGGVLLNVANERFDTSGADLSSGESKAIFVVDLKGNLYASNAHKFAFFIHPTFLAGAPVASAGEIQVKRGVLTAMTNCSGHYKPDYVIAKQQFLEALIRMGITVNDDVKYFDCTKYW